MHLRHALAGAALLFLSALPLAAQAPAAAERSAEPDSLRVTPAWDVARRQPRDGTVALALSRPLRAQDGRLVVVVGRSDLSVLLGLRETRARIPLRGARLPAGDLEIVPYLLSPGGAWRELGRFPFRRLAPGGLDSAAVRPTLDVQSDGQLAADLPAGSPPGVRDGMYQDVSANGGVEAALRRGSAQLSGQALLLGASRPAARLRAAQLGARAPLLDLASYQLRLAAGRLGVSAGQIAIGRDRNLGNQFRSRGVSAQLQLPGGIDAAVGAGAGSELVGWDDPIGLGRASHRILAGSLGLEAVPRHPGLVRLEMSALHGSIQPLPAFNQAAVTDREQSDGVGAQLAAADPSQRVRLALGLARSRFVNPPDPALARDSTLVPVRPETRDAAFAELALDALRSARIGPTSASLSLTARRQRVDPQYRSVAAALQADRDQTTLEATGGLDALQLQGSASAARDNLAGVPTLLTTRTRAGTLNAALPLAQLLRAPATAWWWPALTLAWQSVHQAGEAAPPGGGFRFQSQVPDQVTSSLALGAGWQRASWTLAGRWARARVDNRQPGRENADFLTGDGGVTLALTPWPRYSLTLDASVEAQDNLELGKRSTSRRLALQAGLQPFGHLALSGTWSLATADDPIATRRSRSTDLRLELSQGFNPFLRRGDGAQGRIFLRFARSAAALLLALPPGITAGTQPLPGTLGTAASPARQWSLATGLSLRVF